MKLRVFLNGEGSNRGSYMAVFFQLLKGDFDAILSWPFDYRVTITLLGSNRAQDKVESFIPVGINKALDRPATEANKFLGYPHFLQLRDLDSYIMDGTLFLKVAITQ